MKKQKELSMKFNPGLEKYEPELPAKKSSKKIEFNWIKFILILLGMIAVSVVLYFILI
jgi:hypothetical protein